MRSGFADPVFDAQAVFRGVQDALARPGLPQSVAPPGSAEGLSPAAAAILLCLTDYTTPVWLAHGNEHPAASWLAFHTGARTTTKAKDAQFAVLALGAAAPLLRDFAAGEDCYPDRSATLIVECRDFIYGTRVRLSGPGIRDTVDITPTGPRPGFWAEMAANAARFPLGVDVFLTAGNAMIGLPRSSTIREIA
ncbi:phosphonate C-P lyase system protein PhnH [Rhizomicrobium palustre]